MRQPLFIPPEIKRAIAAHFGEAISKAVGGFFSASEDEDTLTGHLGSALRVSDQAVFVGIEVPGTWTWSVNYTKFRGRGYQAAENLIGADGVFEIRLQFGGREQKKSLLFQAKTNWERDPGVFEQAVKLSTWKEAAFVVNYTEAGFEAFELEDVIRERGIKPRRTMPLQDYLGHSFLDCLVGDTELSYDPRSRLLLWRSHSGEIVGTRFSLPHRIRVKISAPQSGSATAYDKLVPLSKIHEYRMDASPEDILSVSASASDLELGKAKKQAALLYHPDKFPDLSDLLKEILNRRMQEASEAFEEIRIKRKR